MSIRRSLLALIALSFGAELALAQTVADVERIVETWNARRKQAGTWRYVAQGKQFMPKGGISNPPSPFGLVPENGEILPPLPPEDKVFEESFTWVLDLTGRRVRKEHEGFHPFPTIVTFDGDRSYYLSLFDEKRRKSDQIAVLTISPSSLHFEPHDFPVLFDRGIIPQHCVDVRKIKEPIRGVEFTASRRTTAFNDVECVVLQRVLPQLDGHDEFIVDASNEHRILAWRFYMRERLQFSLDISYVKQPDGMKLSGWLCNHFDPDGFIRTQHKIVLKSIDKDPSNVSPADFTLKPKPGMRVMFHRGPDMVVEDDGSMVPAKKGVER